VGLAAFVKEGAARPAMVPEDSSTTSSSSSSASSMVAALLPLLLLEEAARLGVLDAAPALPIADGVFGSPSSLGSAGLQLCDSILRIKASSACMYSTTRYASSSSVRINAYPDRSHQTAR